MYPHLPNHRLLTLIVVCYVFFLHTRKSHTFFIFFRLSIERRIIRNFVFQLKGKLYVRNRASYMHFTHTSYTSSTRFFLGCGKLDCSACVCCARYKYAFNMQHWSAHAAHSNLSTLHIFFDYHPFYSALYFISMNDGSVYLPHTRTRCLAGH